jgi:hypothetical protein
MVACRFETGIGSLGSGGFFIISAMMGAKFDVMVIVAKKLMLDLRFKSPLKFNVNAQPVRGCCFLIGRHLVKLRTLRHATP